MGREKGFSASECSKIVNRLRGPKFNVSGQVSSRESTYSLPLVPINTIPMVQPINSASPTTVTLHPLFHRILQRTGVRAPAMDQLPTALQNLSTNTHACGETPHHACWAATRVCARRGKQEREQGEDVLGSRSIKAARACILKEVIKWL